MAKPATLSSNGLYVGDVLTLPQQIQNLRAMGEGNLFRYIVIGCAIGLVAGLAWFFFEPKQTGRVLALFAAGVSGTLGVVSFRFGPHVRNAAAATRKGRREPATIVLAPDIDDDEREAALHGVLCPRSSHLGRWHIRFGKTFGWKPPEGELQVEAVYLADIPWPVLLVHPDGLLMPNAKPEPV